MCTSADITDEARCVVLAMRATGGYAVADRGSESECCASAPHLKLESALRCLVSNRFRLFPTIRHYGTDRVRPLTLAEWDALDRIVWSCPHCERTSKPLRGGWNRCMACHVLTCCDMCECGG